MSDPATLRELIARLEKATRPDRELDAEIAVVHRNVTRPADKPRVIAVANPREYTFSIDAAVSLVPVGWCWWVNSQKFGRCWLVVATRVADTAQSEKCATPALALCAAALKARVAEMEAFDDR